MKNLFSIGEVSRQQNISRQTLIFYDKIGLFSPAYVDPDNGYRYYSASQLDLLDTICIMKKIGFSLEEIKTHLESYTIDNSISALRKQLSVIDSRLEELQMIKSRVEHRCQELERVVLNRCSSELVSVCEMQSQYILLQSVAAPHSLAEVSLATKQCFVRSFREHLPVYFQSGAVIPLSNILSGRYIEASHAFLLIEKSSNTEGVLELPGGRCVYTYHTGDYPSIGRSYERILAYCRENGLNIISDSYEFAINDYLSTADESEYVTKIIFYVSNQANAKIF